MIAKGFTERIPIVGRNGRHEKPSKTRRKRDRGGAANRERERCICIYTYRSWRNKAFVSKVGMQMRVTSTRHLHSNDP